MSYHLEGAYDGFDDLKEIKNHYKRCRKIQHFILSDEGIKDNPPNCNCCGKIITIETGNRGEYHPKIKKYRIMHYKCSWENLLTQVHQLADIM